MMMINYDFFYKSKLKKDELNELKYDLFLSAYNSSERVTSIFNEINANYKFWLLFKEYGFDQKSAEISNYFLCDQANEAEQIKSFFNWLQKEKHLNIESFSICIDITGFIRPQLLCLILILYKKKLKKVDFIYTDPNRYVKNENTEFSKGNILPVRQVIGFGGHHHHKTDNDLLIIGSGYDDRLISSVSDDKENAIKKLLIGFPSLLADMYQQNILNLSKASESLGDDSLTEAYLAPASDPFKTAKEIAKIVKKHEAIVGEITNLYLSPLSTKPQVLGFALYFLYEKQNTNTSIIFPYTERYQQETTKGISKIHLYTVEF